MAFICPQCLQGSLKITERIELEGDSRSDDIALQLLVCSSCSFDGIAVYQESRRGALDSESYDHYGYAVSDEDFRAFCALLEQCPDRGKSNCDCATHRALNRFNESGRWNALESYDQKSYFQMRFAEDESTA